MITFITDDDVYMEEEKERKEYVMNETGRIWMGTAKNYEGLPWVFGQVCFVKKRKEKAYPRFVKKGHVGLK